jgi:phosphoketolase
VGARRAERGAAVCLLREHLPELKVRAVNLVDLMRLQRESEHSHGMSDAGFDALSVITGHTSWSTGRDSQLAGEPARMSARICCG